MNTVLEVVLTSTNHLENESTFDLGVATDGGSNGGCENVKGILASGELLHLLDGGGIDHESVSIGVDNLDVVATNDRTETASDGGSTGSDWFINTIYLNMNGIETGMDIAIESKY